MAENIFTLDFYKKVYKEIEDYLSDSDKYKPKSSNEDVSVYLNWYDADTDTEYEVELTVNADNEWHDDSFDHAFGTWHDPYPYYAYERLSDICDDAKVWVNGEEVNGFSRDDFYTQFEIPEHNGIKSGDIVIFFDKNKWSEESYEVKCYDTFSGCYVLKTADKDLYRKYVKKAA